MIIDTCIRSLLFAVVQSGFCYISSSVGFYYCIVCTYIVYIFGPRRDEVTGEWRRLHNEELNDLYCSPNIVRVIKWRRMRWAEHVARMGEERGVYRVLVGKL